MKWIKTKSGKWKLLKEGEKTYDYYMTRTYSAKLKKILKTKIFFCEDCKADYSLADPCIHHLSNSYEHEKKYKEYKRILKNKSLYTEEENIRHKGLYE